MLTVLLFVLTSDIPADWAFKPTVRLSVPSPKGTRGNPIDAFLDAELLKTGVAANPPADRSTLLRRASFDFIGLPPTPEEIDDFLADKSPDAWAKQVDRLLESPHYGERSAKAWLDLVRYAESDGYRFDRLRLDAWRYRDYVIRSFNDDKPFDQFVKEQIAGDELRPDDLEANTATGFLRLYPEEEVDAYLHSKRQILLNDVTDTVGTAFLGLTVGCARCHDHKFDPLSQADYYRLQAFFAGFVPVDIPRRKFPTTSRAAAQADAWATRVAPVKQQLAKLEKQMREEFHRIAWKRFPPEVVEALQRPAASRSPIDRFVAAMAPRQYDPPSDKLQEALSKSTPWKTAYHNWKRLERERPSAAGAVLAATDVGRDVPPTFVLKGGMHKSPGLEVQPQFPASLGGGSPRVSPTAGTSGRRTAFANWLTSGSHPLTARVLVNRLWQQHFGRGLVATSADFGSEGERPTNRALLDWLATEAVAKGWKPKAIHRLIATSAAYQRSSADNLAACKVDPDDRLLWRMPRRRLDGESIRDAMLATSGMLDDKMYGPGVFPAFDDGTTPENWLAPLRPTDFNRRSIYLFVRRNLKYPLLDVFDAPDSATPCACRSATNTPVQALHLVNSRLTLEAARRLAGRLAAEKTNDARVMLAYRLCYSRSPDREESAAAKRFLTSQNQLDVSGKAAQPTGAAIDLNPNDGAALVDFCHALLTSNEFLYLD